MDPKLSLIFFKEIPRRYFVSKVQTKHGSMKRVVLFINGRVLGLASSLLRCCKVVHLWIAPVSTPKSYGRGVGISGVFELRRNVLFSRHIEGSTLSGQGGPVPPQFLDQ